MKNLLFPLFAFIGSGILAQGTCSTTVFAGNATYYTPNSSTGACQLDSSEVTPYFCAMNNPQYDTAVYCGTCLEITGAAGTQVAAVWDLCPSCGNGDLDLNPATFQAVVGNLTIGIGSISWKVVSCPWASQALWITNPGGNPWYANFIIHHATNAIDSVEAYVGAGWLALTRQTYNAWTCSSCAFSGDTVLDVRIKDIFGEQITITNVNMNGGPAPQYATGNFTPCMSAGIKVVDNKSEVKLYEKNNILFISSPKAFNKVSVYESSGRLVSTAIYSKTFNEKMNISELHEGMYFAAVYCTDGTIEKVRFLKVQH